MSIALNILGQVFIYGSIAKTVSNNDLNKVWLQIGAVFLIISLLCLFLHKSEFSKLKGERISSIASPIHKFFLSILVMGILQFIFLFWIYSMLTMEPFDPMYLLGVFPLLIGVGVFFNMIRLKGVKFNEDEVVVSNFISTSKISLKDIREIKATIFPLSYKLSYGKDSVRTIHFMTNTGSFGFDKRFNKFKNIIDSQK